MAETQTYARVVIASRAKSIRGVPARLAQVGELVVGKDNVVLKDRYGSDGRKIPQRELDEIIENATEVHRP